LSGGLSAEDVFRVPDWRGIKVEIGIPVSKPLDRGPETHIRARHVGMKPSQGFDQNLINHAEHVGRKFERVEHREDRCLVGTPRDPRRRGHCEHLELVALDRRADRFKYANERTGGTLGVQALAKCHIAVDDENIGDSRLALPFMLRTDSAAALYCRQLRTDFRCYAVAESPLPCPNPDTQSAQAIPDTPMRRLRRYGSGRVAMRASPANSGIRTLIGSRRVPGGRKLGYCSSASSSNPRTTEFSRREIVVDVTAWLSIAWQKQNAHQPHELRAHSLTLAKCPIKQRLTLSGIRADTLRKRAPDVESGRYGAD
jgi:hypothetical protein